MSMKSQHEPAFTTHWTCDGFEFNQNIEYLETWGRTSSIGNGLDGKECLTELYAIVKDTQKEEFYLEYDSIRRL